MVSLVGAVLLSLSVESVQTWTFLPEWVRSAAAWSSGK
jgi:hypothetical protein